MPNPWLLESLPWRGAGVGRAGDVRSGSSSSRDCESCGIVGQFCMITFVCSKPHTATVSYPGACMASCTQPLTWHTPNLSTRPQHRHYIIHGHCHLTSTRALPQTGVQQAVHLRSNLLLVCATAMFPACVPTKLSVEQAQGRAGNPAHTHNVVTPTRPCTGAAPASLIQSAA